MPNWKKIITSGSDAYLKSVTVEGPVINDFTASYAINALNTYNSTALNSGTVQQFSASSATWTIQHNLHELWPMVTIWEENPAWVYNMVIPNSITSIDANTVQVTFTEPIRGYANVSRAGHVVSGSLPWTNLIGPAIITASLDISGSVTATDGFTGSLFGTSSWAFNLVSSSTVNTASYSLTASYVNPLRQDVLITGSLNVSGSTLQVGNNTLLGDTLLTGSITISGSFPVGSYSSSVNIIGDTTMTGYLKFNPQSTNVDTTISASYIFVSGSTNDLYFSQNGSGYNNVTRLRWIEGNLYTGLLHGGLISSASSTTFNVSSGSGIIVNLNASINDDPYPTIQYLNWPNLLSQPLTYRTSSIQTFIGLNSAGGIIQQRDPWTNGQYNTSLSLGTVLHQNTASINGTITYPNVAYGYKQRTYDFIKAFGSLKLSGYNIYPSSSLGLTIGSGTAWSEGRNYENDPNNPSYITDNGTTVSKIFRYYVSGSTYNQDTNGGVGYTTLDPTKYNNNGVLTAVPANKPWSNLRIFYYPNSVTKGIVMYYGNAVYADITEAVANLPYENFLETPNTQQNAVYLGSITMKYNGVFTTPADYSILPAGIFRNVGGSGGGGAAPAATLFGLADVNISGQTNGQPLVYNSASLKWENQSTLTANLVGNALTATSASYAATSSYSKNIVISGSIQHNASKTNVGSSLLVNSSIGNTFIDEPLNSYRSLHVKYHIMGEQGARAGSIMSIVSGSQIQYIDSATNDIGNTDGLILTVALTNGDQNITVGYENLLETDFTFTSEYTLL